MGKHRRSLTWYVLMGDVGIEDYEIKIKGVESAEEAMAKAKEDLTLAGAPKSARPARNYKPITTADPTEGGEGV